MKIPVKIYSSILVLLLVIPGMTSCDDAVTVVPEAGNSITGNVEGTAFTATDIEASKNSNDIFSVAGIINEEASFSLYIRDDGSGIHPVETSGSFSDFTSRLEELFNAQPPLADSILQDSLTTGLEILLSDSDNLLAPDHSFMFYTVGGLIYYSIGGSFTMNGVDEELGRINGALNARMSNFFGGRKDLEMTLDDVQFYLE